MPTGTESRCEPFTSAAIVSAIVAVPLVRVHRALADVMVLPDYGDQWRWSTSISADGRLTPAEVLGEAEPLGHSSYLSIIGAHVSMDSGYDTMWMIGSIGFVAFAATLAWLVCSVTESLDSTNPRALAALAILTGVLAVRLDVPGPLVTTLLHFEMLYYAVAALGAVVAVVVMSATDEDQGLVELARTHLISLIGLTLLLVVGDAPASVLTLSLLGVALLTQVARHPTRRLALLNAVSAAIALLVRMAISPSESRSTWSLVDLVNPATYRETLELLGAAIANLGSWTTDESTRQVLHIMIGSVVVGLLCGALVVVLRPSTLARVPHRLQAALLIVSGFVMVSAFSIAANRVLNDSHHLSRFVRSTTLTVVATVLALLVLVAARRRSATFDQRQLLVVIGIVALIALVRIPGITDVDDTFPFVRRIRNDAIALYCSGSKDPDEWARFWGPLASGDRIDIILDHNLFGAARTTCGSS